MRIVVTGASGFVGRALVQRLAGAGHQVVALAREMTAGRVFPDGVDVVICGDLTRFSGWAQALADADAVVHLAAIAHRSFHDEQRMRAVNCVAARNAAQAAAVAKVRLVFVSSAKVLGEETSAHPFGTDDLPAPPDPYARAKADAESALREIVGLDYVVLRPPLVYGPGVKANFLSLMRAVARGFPLPLANIENVRSMIYVGNLADAVALCAESPAAAGKTYLVADGAALSTPQLCRALGAALGRPARLFSMPLALLDLVGGDRARRLTRSLEVDDRAIRSELGWRPPFTFEQGLRATADWYLAQGR